MSRLSAADATRPLFADKPLAAAGRLPPGLASPRLAGMLMSGLKFTGPRGSPRGSSERNSVIRGRQ